MKKTVYGRYVAPLFGALPRRGYDELDDLFSGYLTAMEAMAHL